MRQLALSYCAKGYNCVQSILKAAAEHFGFDLSDQCCDMSNVLNNGFGTGLFCGALLAGFMVFGLMLDENTAKTARLRLLCDFKEKYNCFDCACLECNGLIGDVAEMIQIIVEDESIDKA